MKGLKKHFSIKKLTELCKEYLNLEGVKTIPGLAVYIGVDSETFAEMQKSGDKKSREIIALAKTHIEKDLIENGLRGKYNATMSSFLLKSVFSYRDKGEEQSVGNVKIEVADELKQFAK